MPSGLEEELESFEEQFLKDGRQTPCQMPGPSSPSAQSVGRIMRLDPAQGESAAIG